MPKETVLIVDDEHLVRWTLQQKLEKWGYNVSLAEDGAKALSRLRADNPDLIILDVKLPNGSGIEVLSDLRKRKLQVPVIMVTGFGVVDDAVQSLKLGAYDFIEKPFNFDRLQNSVRNAMEASRLRSQVALTHEIQRSEFNVEQIIGTSNHIRAVRKLVQKVAGSEAATILIQGESGTGKDLVAHSIHFESPRRDRPFFAINCAAIPEELMESELFGHERGAFTDARFQKRGMFEMADGGTLFLDEIAEMNLGMQAKLLRVLEGQSFRRVGGVNNINVDVRVIVASNSNLKDAVLMSKFRRDLYFRLAIIELSLRPLREHKEDVPLLIEYFVDYYNQKFLKDIVGVTKEAEKLLMEYNWPGNIRELRNAIERAMILAEGDCIEASILPMHIAEGVVLPLSHGGESAGTATELPPEGVPLYDVEKGLIRQALEQANGNKTTAARLLHITRDALRYKVKKYNLE